MTHSDAGIDGPPRRVQLRRTKGWRMPPNTVVVSRPSKWGNPWIVSDTLCAFDAVDAFRHFIEGKPWDDPHMAALHARFTEGLSELRGKNLACWCKPRSPCHADVLLEMAND